jgi:hypothetical protein
MKYACSTLVVMALALACASDVSAGRGSATLKRISRAVALIAVDVSKAGTEEESVVLAETARRRLGVYLAGLPEFDGNVLAAPGYCGILVFSDHFQVWGEASRGRLINAGVDYSR